MNDTMVIMDEGRLYRVYDRGAPLCCSRLKDKGNQLVDFLNQSLELKDRGGKQLICLITNVVISTVC